MKKLKPVEGSADDDVKEIEEANQIRLRAISTIQALLNIWTLHRRRSLLLSSFQTPPYFGPADRTIIGTF